MILDEARLALPLATFKRTSDGDGAALVEVTTALDESMILWADDADADAAIDWSKAIRTIETFSPAFHTLNGVRPGALVKDVKTREFKPQAKILSITITARDSAPPPASF